MSIYAHRDEPAFEWDHGSPRSSMTHAEITANSSVTGLRDTIDSEKETSSVHDGHHDETNAASREKNVEAQTATEDILPDPVVVPRSERHGLLAGLALVAEIEEPKHYKKSTKWWITFVIGVAGIAAPIGSTVVLSSLPAIAKEFDTPQTVANLSVALYMLALGIFPIFWSSFSEALGRRTIYIISFFLFIVFNILSAKAANISMLVVLRILAGRASGSVQAVGAGTIADIWNVHERGKAMALFYIGPMCGPLLAPIIGGALQLRWGWRSTMWFLVIYGVITFGLLVFALPETHKTRTLLLQQDDLELKNTDGGRPLSRISSRQVINNSKKTLRILNAVFVEPLRIVQYLQFPAVAITIYYASITFGVLYVLQIAIQSTFAKPPYNFSSLDVGLCYIPGSLGYLSSALFAGKWTDKVMAREAKKAGRYDASGKLVFRPEDRMRENVWVAALMYPVALIFFGWTAEKHLPWAVPLLSNFFFGLGTMMVFSTVTTMLTEFAPKKAASMVALNNLCRNLLSATGGVIAQPLLDAIGNGWTFTIFGGITFASCVIIWAMRHYGPHWRLTMEKKLQAKGL